MWKVPRMWEGGECWIIGGGPSLIEQFDIPADVVVDVRSCRQPLSVFSPYMQAIHSKHIIGINAAFLLGRWVDMVFFGDNGFFLKNRRALAAFAGLKVSCAPKVNQPQYRGDGIKFTPRNGSHSRGIATTRGTVSWNKNSGAAAISVAAHTGAKRIILLGFDMRCGEDAAQHWHAEYGRQAGNPKNEKGLPFPRHLLGFPAIARDARRMGIEIINASPHSRITEFKQANVKDLI